jgi:hypothetical protein
MIPASKNWRGRPYRKFTTKVIYKNSWRIRWPDRLKNLVSRSLRSLNLIREYKTYKLLTLKRQTQLKSSNEIRLKASVCLRICHLPSKLTASPLITLRIEPTAVNRPWEKAIIQFTSLSLTALHTLSKLWSLHLKTFKKKKPFCKSWLNWGKSALESIKDKRWTRKNSR